MLNRLRLFLGGLSLPVIIGSLFLVLAVVAVPITIFALRQSTSSTPRATSVQPVTPAVRKFINPTEATTTNGRLLPQDQPVAKIGSETIFNRDLNYILATQFPQDYANSDPAVLRNLALPIAIDQSVLLQENRKKGLAKLSPELFNNPAKNYHERDKLVQKLTGQQKAKDEKISGGLISVWYHNVKMPSIPLSDAQNLAYKTITTVYNNLKSQPVNKAAFVQAAETIKNNSALAQIDPSYKGNAYFEFSDKTRNEPISVRPAIDQEIWKLKPGELSKIVPIPAARVQFGQQDEEFFVIVTVYSRTNTGQGNFADWLTSVKKGYPVTYY